MYVQVCSPRWYTYVWEEEEEQEQEKDGKPVLRQEVALGRHLGQTR